MQDAQQGQRARANVPAPVYANRECPVGVNEIASLSPIQVIATGQNGQQDLTKLGSPEGSPLRVTAIYAQKGGVGKTTLAGSFAWELAMRGRRVMLVDADPQCNLSEWLCPEFEEMVEHGQAREFDYTNNNISTLFQDVLAGTQDRMRAVRCFPVDIGNNANEGRLFVLLGSQALTRYEIPLGVALFQGGFQHAQRNMPGTFPYGIRATAWFHGVQEVIIDLNPGGGVVNQLLVLTSDAVVIPVNPSGFSVQFLRQGGDFMRVWKESYLQHVRNLNAGDPEQGRFMLPTKMPRLAAVVINNFRPYRRDGNEPNDPDIGMPARAYEEFVQRINVALNQPQGFLARLHSLNFENCDRDGAHASTFALRDLASLSPISHATHTAPQYVTRMADGVRRLRANLEERRDNVRQIIAQMVNSAFPDN